jgi:MHS family proline/betaine transporter-like MFS transporter
MQNLGYTRGESGFVSVIILITMVMVFPISAKLSDTWGRKTILTIGAIAIIVSAYPMIASLGHLDIISATCSQMVFAASIAFYMGPMPATAVEMFPTKVRFTGLGLSHNTCAAIFGGTAPMMAMILERVTGDHFAIGYYVSILAIFNLFILRKFYKETHHKSVNEGHVM